MLQRIEHRVKQLMNPEKRELVFASAEQVEMLSRRLARKLAKKGRYSAVVAITRGGMMPAMYVAYELGIDLMGTISFASYSVDGTQTELRHVDGPTEKILALDRGDGLPVLAIDDIADRGNTVEATRLILPRCHFAVLHVKPQCYGLVDTAAARIAQQKWIYYPWNNQKLLIPRAPIVEGRK